MERKYRPNYDEAFRDEQLKWFEERMEQLPKSLQINAATSTTNLPMTVVALMRTLRQNKPNVIMSGYMDTLVQIREELEEQGL